VAVAPQLRPYRSEDLEGLRDVCFATGFMGDPVAEQFSDRDAFACLFCDWYVQQRPDTCWVLDDGAGRVVGYLLGSPDGPPPAGTVERRLLTRHLLGRALLVRPGTARFLARATGDVLRDRSLLHPPPALASYPADLHIDLLPEARGRGLGALLIRTWLDRLGELGVPGVHLGTMGENADAIAFFGSQGFEPVGPAVPGAGFRMPDGRRCSVQWFARTVDRAGGAGDLRPQAAPQA
jgi:ribosomal protein S18 acetylase RimI-like enzyme